MEGFRHRRYAADSGVSAPTATLALLFETITGRGASAHQLLVS